MMFDIIYSSGIMPRRTPKYVDKALKNRHNSPGSVRPSIYGEAFRNSVLKLIGMPVPKNLATWDRPVAAEKLDTSVDAVRKALRKEGLDFQGQRSWSNSTDKNYASKAADIIGLYLDPPLNAIVLCVDEKSLFRAIKRKSDYITTGNGKAVRAYKSAYNRHGTLNLCTALTVPTGKNQGGKVTKEKKQADFQTFMDGIVAEYTSEQEIHVVLNNYSSHKKIEEWSVRNRNVHFYFTPKAASWLNQVEIWFGIFSRKAFGGASFSSPQELRQLIEDFIKGYNPDSKPFKWCKRGVKKAQIIDINLAIK